MIGIDKAAINAVFALMEATGTTAKKRIMVQAGEIEDFRRFLYYALNPMLTYKVSEATLRRQMTYRPSITLTMTNIFEVCDTLAARRAVDDVTLYQVCGFLNAHDGAERELYIKLLAKTLRLGVTAKTVNIVFKDLIPEWEVQQAYPINKYPLRDGVWFTLTQKLNGVRATYYHGQLIARSGTPYEGLSHITTVIEETVPDGIVLDGELTLLDKGTLSDNEAFRMAAGIINSDAVNKTAICYTIFDAVPVNEFETNACVTSYKERRDILDYLHIQLMAAQSDRPLYVSVLPTLYQGTDQRMIETLLEDMVRQDKEGLMLNLDVPYRRTRHRGILKVKRFYTMDLSITGCEEGTGRLSGTLGALVLDYKGNPVKVGTGFTDEQRSNFWAKRDELIGLLCEVKYKEVSSDKTTGAESLQFPVFVCIREDKSVVSYG